MHPHPWGETKKTHAPAPMGKIHPIPRIVGPGGRSRGCSPVDNQNMMLHSHLPTKTLNGKEPCTFGYQAIFSAAAPVHPTTRKHMRGDVRLRGPGSVKAGYMVAMTSISWSQVGRKRSRSGHSVCGTPWRGAAQPLGNPPPPPKTPPWRSGAVDQPLNSVIELF